MLFLDCQGNFYKPQGGFIIILSARGDLAIRIDGESLGEEISRQRLAKNRIIRRCWLWFTRF